MSLEYRNDPPEERPYEFAEERAAQYQRAEAVTPWYSIALIASVFVVFLCQIIADGADSILKGASLSVLFAGFVKPLFSEGQFWRILTGATMHSGLMHLAFNSYALFVLGKLIETLSNRANLAIVFLLAAIGGGLMSFVFLPDGTSVGASGGVLGFLGYLTVYGFKRRRLLPEGFLNNMLFNVVFIAFIGIFVLPRVDNYGHLGGLLAGTAYGLVQIPSDLYKDPRETNSLTKIVGAAALGIFVLAAFASALIMLGVIKISFPESLLTQ